VPEADVRQAGINTLANVSALLLAAGQPMSGQQRAQLLAGVGPALGGMQSDIFRASQARLMTAQQQAALEEAREIKAINERRKTDPEGLAKDMNLPVDRLKLLSGRDLRDIAKQIVIRQATTEPSTAALVAAAAGVPQIETTAPTPQGQQPVAAATGAPSVVAEPSRPQAQMAGQIPNELLSAISPEARRTVEIYQRALNDPRIQMNPERVKTIQESIYRLVPGAKEASEAQGKALGAAAAAAPAALQKATDIIALLDATATHPGRAAGTGLTAGLSMLPAELSFGARDFANFAKQLEGQTFLQAYESLKGTGQITEIEGQKATQAISRIGDRYVTEEQYLKAIRDLRDVVEATRGRLSKKLGVEYTPAPVPDVYKTLEPRKDQPKSQAPEGGQPRIRRWNPQTGTLE
jgi:hypothetical protein